MQSRVEHGQEVKSLEVDRMDEELLVYNVIERYQPK